MIQPVGSDPSDLALDPYALPGDMPILYEDDEEDDMGESNPHVDNVEILHVCLSAHFAPQPDYQVFSNMNLYYRPKRKKPWRRPPYVSPDVMVVTPPQRLPDDLTSYLIGREGPAPRVTVEALSERSAQQRDLREKVEVYAMMKVAEYILVDPSGRFLPQRLLLKRLQANVKYKNDQDADGGVTSEFGFRLIIETDGRVRVIDVATGRPYVRPDEAEERVRALEEELARLRQLLREPPRP